MENYTKKPDIYKPTCKFTRKFTELGKHDEYMRGKKKMLSCKIASFSPKFPSEGFTFFSLSIFSPLNFFP